MDDMIVKSDMREKHFEALEKFMQRAKKYNLRLSLKKCIFSTTYREDVEIYEQSQRN